MNLTRKLKKKSKKIDFIDELASNLLKKSQLSVLIEGQANGHYHGLKNSCVSSKEYFWRPCT